MDGKEKSLLLGNLELAHLMAGIEKCFGGHITQLGGEEVSVLLMHLS